MQEVKNLMQIYLFLEAEEQKRILIFLLQVHTAAVILRFRAELAFLLVCRAKAGRIVLPKLGALLQAQEVLQLKDDQDLILTQM